jgi:hypothetical protein
VKITAEPRSDQWNADDFIGGPRTFTIAGVKVGTAEQKYDIALEEGEGRVWRPPLTMLRLLMAAWGNESDVWVGRRVTLYRDPNVTFGRDQPGGIRISHLSHIDKAIAVALTEKRGKRALHKIEPLPDAPAPAPEPTEADVAACTDLDALRDMWKRTTNPDLHALITARKDELTVQEPTDG